LVPLERCLQFTGDIVCFFLDTGTTACIPQQAAATWARQSCFCVYQMVSVTLSTSENLNFFSFRRIDAALPPSDQRCLEGTARTANFNRPTFVKKEENSILLDANPATIRSHYNGGAPLHCWGTDILNSHNGPSPIRICHLVSYRRQAFRIYVGTISHYCK